MTTTAGLYHASHIARGVLGGFPQQMQAASGENTTEPMEGDNVFDPEKMFEYFTREIIAPSEPDRKRRSYDILGRAENAVPSSSRPCVIDEEVWTDLNLLSGSRDGMAASLGELLTQGFTNTEMGNAFFHGLLARPNPFQGIHALKTLQLCERYHKK